MKSNRVSKSRRYSTLNDDIGKYGFNYFKEKVPGEQNFTGGAVQAALLRSSFQTYL